MSVSQFVKSHICISRYRLFHVGTGPKIIRHRIHGIHGIHVCFTPVVYAYCLHLQTKSSRTKQKQCQPSQFILPASHCTLAADGLNATVAGGRRRGRCRRQELTREGGNPHLTRPAPAPWQSQRLLAAAAASLQDIVD